MVVNKEQSSNAGVIGIQVFMQSTLFEIMFDNCLMYQTDGWEVGFYCPRIK